MAPNMSQMSSMTFAEKLALRGSPQLCILLRKMALLKERIGPLWKLPVPCYVTKVFQSFYGEKLRTLLCTYKIDAPHFALDSKTLEEVFSGKKPDVSHFRAFGCPVYFHVPQEKRAKLDASGKKGMFVGYSETSKAYRIYVLGQREVEICHDVIFDGDASLRKLINLPSSKEDNDERTGKQKELKDEMMP